MAASANSESVSSSPLVEGWARGTFDGASSSTAKSAVEAHRVTPEDVTTWKEQFAVAEARAKWVGVATYEASNHTAFPFRDSEAARWRANAARRAKDNARAGVDGRRRRAKRAVVVAAAAAPEASLLPLTPSPGGSFAVRCSCCRRFLKAWQGWWMKGGE